MEVSGVRRIIGFMLAHPDGFASLDEAASAIASYRDQVPRRGAGEGLRKVLRQGDDLRWRWHWDPRFILSRDAEGGFDQVHTEQRLERLSGAARQVRVPSLLLRGAQSDLVSEEGAHELLAAMPDVRYVNVSGAGHMVAGDRNDVFTDEVRRFVSTLSG